MFTIDSTTTDPIAQQTINGTARTRQLYRVKQTFSSLREAGPLLVVKSAFSVPGRDQL